MARSIQFYKDEISNRDGRIRSLRKRIKELDKYLFKSHRETVHAEIEGVAHLKALDLMAEKQMKTHLELIELKEKHFSVGDDLPYTSVMDLKV